ncbi:MAG: hypothetical protein ACKO1F_14240, partial [Flammeovirgaceae bacterium]
HFRNSPSSQTTPAIGKVGQMISRIFIDESFKFKRSSSGKLLIREFGLVIKVEIESKNYSIEFIIDRIEMNNIDKKNFEFPANFHWREFYPLSDFPMEKW